MIQKLRMMWSVEEKNRTVGGVVTTQSVMSVGFYVQCEVEGEELPIQRYTVYRGDDCMRRFLEDMLVLRSWYEERNLPLVMSDEDEADFQACQECHICKKTLILEDWMNKPKYESLKESRKKVRDHCHITGEFRGAAHNKCNLNTRKYLNIPIYAHNASGYDNHFVITEMSQMDEIREDNQLNVIRTGGEKYLLRDDDVDLQVE